MLVYLRDESAQTLARAATCRQQLQIKLSASPSHSILWTVCCLLVGCLTSQQNASVSQGRTCFDNFTSCHMKTDDANQTLYLTQSQYTGTGPTSPSSDPITPGAWQGNHWSAKFEVAGMTRPGKISTAQARIEPRIFRSRGGRLNG